MAAVSAQVDGLEKTVTRSVTRATMVPTVSSYATVRKRMFVIVSMEHVSVQTEGQGQTVSKLSVLLCVKMEELAHNLTHVSALMAGLDPVAPLLNVLLNVQTMEEPVWIHSSAAVQQDGLDPVVKQNAVAASLVLTVAIYVHVKMVPHVVPLMENAIAYLDTTESHVKRSVQSGSLDMAADSCAYVTHSIQLTVVTWTVIATAKVAGMDLTVQIYAHLALMAGIADKLALARIEEPVVHLQDDAVVEQDTVAAIVRNCARLENLVLDARRIVCARIRLCVIQWMAHVTVSVAGLVRIVTNVILVDWLL
jgi:hypothetical protein